MSAFPTLDLVTVHSGVLVSDSGIAAIYTLCGHMLRDDSLMTHQLPNASRACMADLERQHPWLADLDPPAGDIPALKAWCADLIERVGAEHWVEPIDQPEWVTGNALRDLHDIAEGRPVMVVKSDE